MRESSVNLCDPEFGICCGFDCFTGLTFLGKYIALLSNSNGFNLFYYQKEKEQRCQRFQDLVWKSRPTTTIASLKSTFVFFFHKKILTLRGTVQDFSEFGPVCQFLLETRNLKRLSCLSGWSSFWSGSSSNKCRLGPFIRARLSDSM